MKMRTVEIWVGTFFVMGVAALLMLALQVSGLSHFYRADNTYKVQGAFTHIGGLKVRSKVTISGVAIGRVTDISLKQNEYGEYQAIVEMSIDASVKNIPRDSSAKIFTSGLLGDNYIGLVPGMSEEFLQPDDLIELTSQAVLLEDLISKFAVGGSKDGN